VSAVVLAEDIIRLGIKTRYANHNWSD